MAQHLAITDPTLSTGWRGMGGINCNLTSLVASPLSGGKIPQQVLGHRLWETFRRESHRWRGPYSSKGLRHFPPSICAIFCVIWYCVIIPLQNPANPCQASV